MEKERLKNKIKELSKKYLNDIISIRRHLHSNPELSFEEYETSNYIANILRKDNLNIRTGIANTGLVVTIEGDKKSDKVVAFRADIDALPIQEENDIPYKSKKNGVMHACGHDVHTSSLIGVAKILNDLRKDFGGKFMLIFQPAEEKLPGGAKTMIEEGIFDTLVPKNMFAQHVISELNRGEVGFNFGTILASADEIRLTVKGKGGHAAYPHRTIDPVVIASNIIVSLQQVISRSRPPLISSVLSFGKIVGQGATNVIPNEVYIEGTFRSMDEDWRYIAHEKIIKIAEDIAKSFGGVCEVDITKGYPSLKNDFVVTNNAILCAKSYLGDENVKIVEPKLFAEDFAYFAQKIPSCFYFLGIKNDSKSINSPIHTSTFDIDEDALEHSMGLMAYIAINEINS